MDDIVSTQWLADHIDDAGLKVIDATRHHFEPHRSSADEYRAGHIPGALFLDMVSFVDASAPTENTAPTAEQFTERMRELGIDADSRIVLYDDSVVKTAARAWFLFRAFGLSNVAVLDGGLTKWKAEGRPLTDGQAAVVRSDFTAVPNPAMLRSKEQLVANLKSGAELVVDGRGAAHFTGQDDDPHPTVAAGHIPGSRNVPFWDLFGADGTFKDADALRSLFENAGVDLARPLVTSCGSGVVACSLALALRRLGKSDVALYDGSWTEWGADSSLPRETGDARSPKDAQMTQENRIQILDLELESGATISPFVWQAKYAAAHKGLDFDVIPGGFTSLERRTEGRSTHRPGIRDGDTWVFESLRSGDFQVADYLDRAYPDRPALFKDADHRNYVKFLDNWLWSVAIGPWFSCYILDYHDSCLPEDRPSVREHREREFLGGRTLEEVQAGREDRLPLVLPALEPLRELLRETPWLGGDAPDFSDYSALSVFLWVASVGRTPPLTEDDPLRDWIERGFDLFGGLGRHPGLNPVFGLKLREGDPAPFVKA